MFNDVAVSLTIIWTDSEVSTFCFQLCSRPEERSRDVENQLEQFDHQAASVTRRFLVSTAKRISAHTAPRGSHYDALAPALPA